MNKQELAEAKWDLWGNSLLNIFAADMSTEDVCTAIGVAKKRFIELETDRDSEHASMGSLRVALRSGRESVDAKLENKVA